MLKILGYVLAVLGLVMIFIPFVEWLGIRIRRKNADSLEAAKASIWDVLLAFLLKAGWVATAGLILIYLGLKALGLSGL